jgi:hypothetical protein
VGAADDRRKEVGVDVMGKQIHLGAEVWKYRMSGDCAIVISPCGKRTNVRIVDLLGITWDDVERARWKQTSNANVHPSDVKAYIELHGKEMRKGAKCN